MSALSVLSPPRFARLIAADSLNISRDPMLLFAIVMSAFPAIALYFGRGAMNDAVLNAFGIVDVSRYVAAPALMVPALLIGWVTGFLMLEDRDDNLLPALDVTPLGKVGFLIYRVTVTFLVTMALTLVASFPILPDASLAMRLLVAPLIGCNGVLAAVILPAIARNKVEGLALTKVINLAGIVPLLALIPSPWRYVAGIVPSYWLGELLELSSVAQLPMAMIVIIAVLIHGFAAYWLFRRFGRS